MLTDTKAKKIKSKDKPLADGTVTGLRLLSTNKNGRGKWKLRFVSPTTRRRRDMGLGTYPDISITQVRDLANAARKKVTKIYNNSTTYKRSTGTASYRKSNMNKCIQDGSSRMCYNRNATNRSGIRKLGLENRCPITGIS